VAQGLDTWKKLAEEAVTVHSRATWCSEGYSDIDIGIATLYHVQRECDYAWVLIQLSS
jgi:hypothetical protein